MTRQFIRIGPGPETEELAQLTDSDFHKRNQLECDLFIDGIRRYLGREPEGARLGILKFDTGHTFREVVCYYDEGDQEAKDYAERVERQAPHRWNECGFEEPVLRMGRGR